MIKNYTMFKESQNIQIDDNTNLGKVIWMDNPYKDKDGGDADLLVKTDKPSKSQPFTWARVSELTKIEPKEKKEEIMEEPVKEESIPTKPDIEYGEMMKLDIRVGKVESVDKVKGKDRLLILQVNTGSDTRQIVTNLGGVYKPEELQGKCFPFILNLKPARIGGVESNGMIFAADKDGKTLLVEVNVPIGSRIL